LLPAAHVITAKHSAPLAISLWLTPVFRPFATQTPKTTINPEENKQIPAPVPVVRQPEDEFPSPVLVPQTFRLPQRLVDDLARAAIERKIKRRKPWSQQDIVAEAIKEWLRKHVSK
jgi:hypothetical protein